MRELSRVYPRITMPPVESKAKWSIVVQRSKPPRVIGYGMGEASDMLIIKVVRSKREALLKRF